MNTILCEDLDHDGYKDTSGLILTGDVKNIKSIRSVTGQTLVLAAVNNDTFFIHLPSS